MATPERVPLQSLLLAVFCVTLALVSSVHATPRLVVTVPQLSLAPTDTSGIITVYANNYRDSLAGVELQLLLTDSSSLTFLPIVDTVGTLMSKWEIIMIGTQPGGIHVLGLANATKFTVNPPPPSSGHPLIRFHYRVNRDNIPSGVNVGVMIDSALSAFGFSNPDGQLIGVVQHVVYDTTCFRCTDGTPEACNNWEVVTEPPCDSIYFVSRSVTELDTSQVFISNGGIYIPPCCNGMRGNINGDSLNVVNLADLSMLISHLVVRPIKFGCLFEADLNSSGLVDLTDLSMLIAYLIQGQPLPPCPL